MIFLMLSLNLQKSIINLYAFFTLIVYMMTKKMYFETIKETVSGPNNNMMQYAIILI